MAARSASPSSATRLVIGVTGHRKLSANELPALRAQVQAFLLSLQARYPELPLVLLSSLAEGADQLAAQVALDLGVPVIAPLPLPLALYRDDFDTPGKRAMFEQQLQRVEVLTLPLQHGNGLDAVAGPGLARDQQYAQAGVFVSSHCHILLALWDGHGSDRLGGTAQVVRFHLHGEMPGQIERRRTATTLLGLDEETVVFHIPASRDGAESTPPQEGHWLTAGRAFEAGTELPATFDLSFHRHAEFNTDGRGHAAAIMGSAASPTTSAPCPIQDTFAIADGLARIYQRRVTRVLRITYTLAALMGIAFFTYTHVSAVDVVIYGFLLLFLAGVGVVLVAKRGEWQRKYLDYRALAEGLRVQSFWRRAGIIDLNTPAFAHDNFLQKQDVELGWIRNAMRGASLDGMRASAPAGPAQIEAVIAEWIGTAQTGGQRRYYALSATRKERVHGRAELLGLCCLALGIGISVLLVIFARQLTPDTKHALVATMGMVSVAAAVHEAYAYKKADKELIKQYRFMQRIFEAAYRRLASCTGLEEKRQVLRALGEASLAEHAEWTLMHRERPLQHTRL